MGFRRKRKNTIKKKKRKKSYQKKRRSITKAGMKTPEKGKTGTKRYQTYESGNISKRLMVEPSLPPPSLPPPSLSPPSLPPPPLPPPLQGDAGPAATAYCDARLRPITDDDLLIREKQALNATLIEESKELDKYNTIPNLDICKIECDDNYNCEIFSFDFINNIFDIKDTYEYDYVITEKEPTRIYYGPAIYGPDGVDPIKCLMIKDDTARENYTDVVSGDYRLLNHNCLADNLKVIAAGEVQINRNQLTFNNVSGHYQASINDNTKHYINKLVLNINPDYTCNFEEL
jgi:hypothetical protein